MNRREIWAYSKVAPLCVLVAVAALSLLPATTKDAMKRVNVQLPDEIHTRAKVIAVLKGVTLNEYLEAAIREAVERDKSVLDDLKRK